MANLLLGLALPLLLGPVLESRNGVGGAVGRFLIAGLGLCAIHQGTGTLDPGALAALAARSPQDAWFIGITAGAMATGAALSARRSWRGTLLASPLAAALLFSLFAHLPALAVGAAVGCVPAALGGFLGWIGRSRSSDVLAGVAERQPPWRGTIRSPALAALIVVVAAIGPIGIAIVLVAALAWLEWWRMAPRSFPMASIVATILLLAWAWLALAIAGDPFVGLRELAAGAPISPVAGEGLALLAVGWAIALGRPWPFGQQTRPVMLLPVVAVVLHLTTAGATPEGIDHWQPVLSTLLVIAALVAVARRRWHAAAAAMMLLAATRGGTVPFVVALLWAVAPVIRPAGERIRWLAAGVLAALLVCVMLHDQVLLAVLLAFGLATLANRADRVHL